MRRIIRSGGDDIPAPPQALSAPPDDVALSLAPSLIRTQVEPCVRTGEYVTAGQAVAQGRHLTVHASCSGNVNDANAAIVAIKCDAQQKSPVFDAPPPPGRDELPDFIGRMGLVGMGGSMFPSSIKLAAAKNVHTLVINAVECEPGIEIDEALFLHETDRISAGVQVLREALGLKRIVLATKRSSAGRLKSRTRDLKWDILVMPNRYPGGAERLIVGKLAGHIPPAAVLPFKLGYLVMSVASLWSVGRGVSEGRPCIDRPLTLRIPEREPKNLIVPVGTSYGHLLKVFDVVFDPESDLLIAGGPMMGHTVTPAQRVLKGTNAVVLKAKEKRLQKAEEPCILCGSCFDACPLRLHPSVMADRIKEKKYSRPLEAHLHECFLCGACSAVCPANIPLVQYFHEGKKWLKEQK